MSSWIIPHWLKNLHPMICFDNLKRRGIPLALVCSLCLVEEETSYHIFFYLILTIPQLPICKQVKELLLAAIINVIATMWYCRNKSRFDSINISRFQAFSRNKLVTSTTECESSSVVDIFNAKSQPPWKLSNFRNHYSELWSTKNLKVTHISREGNDCPDKLAAFGVQNETPQFLMEEYNRNRFQLLSYRFRYV
ncbi:hypothetical protein Lal_00036365 [Lupinus albus]|nr:hypothetical protein Lal_00036365 [Lupinus albus]